MFGNIKIKKFFSKFRIFKHVRELKAKIFRLNKLLVDARHEIKTLKKQLENKVKTIIYHEKVLKDIVAENDKIKTKHEKASKYVAGIKKNIYEFLNRVQANPNNIPDDIISGDMRTFRVWLMEPFMEKEWEAFRPVNRRELFVDGPSAAKGFIKISNTKIVKDAEFIDEDTKEEEDN